MHATVRFYLNGDYVVDYVRDKDLQDYIEYNKVFRFGCFLFVDGEYVCGGVLLQPYQDEFIEKCKQRLQEINV